MTLKGEKHEVTRIASSPDKQHLAVGYTDGKVCVYNLKSGESTITFSGHKSGITALQYDDKGLRLVSGGKVHQFRENVLHVDDNIPEVN